MKKMKNVLLAVLTLGLAALTAGAASVVPGQWNTDFTSSKAYAEANNVPIVVVWGNTGCSYCNVLSKVLGSAAIMDWAKEHPIVLVLRHETYQEDASKYSADHQAAADWITKLADRSTLNGNPKVGVYWKKADGTVVCSKAFTGRVGKMPATTPQGDLAGQFANSLDLLVGDYGKASAGAFAFGDTDTDHLEANGKKSYVTVPFVRDSARNAITEKLVVSYPAALGQGDVTIPLSWQAGASELTVDVSVYWQQGAVGQSATLKLYDSTGTLSATSHIRYVNERTCSLAYPRFVGEGYAYGEWSMDYEAAKSRAKSDGGYILALFTGTMWCPYCLGLDKVFEDTRFKSWARANNVSLVMFDQGLASSPASAAGTLQARLLTYTAGADHYAEGQDPYGAGVLRSGAYYMSGKGISASAAASARAQTTKYTAAFLSPEATGARCGNPTLLLVKGDKVVGRMATLRNGYNYNIDETVARFSDLLALAARDNEYDDYASTTTRTIKPDSNELVETELQISRRNAFFTFKGTTTGRYAFTAVNKTSDEPVKVSVYAGQTLLGEGEDEVSVSIGASALATGVSVKLSAYSNTSRTVCTGGKTSRISVCLTATREGGAGGEDDGPGFDPDGNPCFGWSEYSITAWQGLSCAVSFNIANADGASSVTIKKSLGSLPAGMKLAYDKSKGRAVLSGMPSKTGVFESDWYVTARVGGATKSGETSSFAITVADPSGFNPYLGQARKATIPLLSEEGYLAGTLDVSVTAKNKITAKYAGTESKTLSFSGSWNDVDAETGVASSQMTKGDASLELSMSDDGMITAKLTMPAEYSYFATEDTVTLTGTAAPSASGDFSDYQGYYTVTLPVKDETAHIRGTGYLTLKMATASAAKKGTMTYAGIMPNGTVISGTANLSQSGDDDFALLPVFKRSGKDVFAALLKIEKDAAATWGETGSENVQTVYAAATPYQLHRETGFEFCTDTDVYGGYYEPNSTPLALAEMTSVSPNMRLEVDSESAAQLVATSSGFTVEKVTGLSLSFTKSTGIFTGKAKVVDSTGKAVSGTFKGVLMPGWTGCGACGDETIIRPFGSGTLSYKDKVGGKSVTVSVPVDIEAPEANAK